MTQSRACPDCRGQGIEEVYGGHGTVIEAPCPTCRGSGLAPCDEPPKGEDAIAAEGHSPASAVGESRGAQMIPRAAGQRRTWGRGLIRKGKLR